MIWNKLNFEIHFEFKNVTNLIEIDNLNFY